MRPPAAEIVTHPSKYPPRVRFQGLAHRGGALYWRLQKTSIQAHHCKHLAMYRFLEITENIGLYQTLLPVFDDARWSDIVPASGFVWIETPSIDLTGQLDQLVRRSLFGDEVTLDLSCAIQRLEIDVCLPASDFLRNVAKRFPGGINFSHAEKRQPPGLHLAAVPREQWRDVMRQNQIAFHLHRPAAGEPSLVVSTERELVEGMVGRFR